MKKYAKIWWLLAGNASQSSIASRFGAFILVTGKILRFSFFLFFLTIISTQIKHIAGYTQWQIIFFYLTYQLMDTLPQFFMREVYNFRRYVVSGDFDYFLLRPFSPLFRSLFGGTDILDLPMLCISVVAIGVTISHLMNITAVDILIYILLLLNAFVIAVSFHILILSLGVVTTEIDNATMLYRDLTAMGRVPVDVYKEPLHSVITFIIPVGIMMTIPAKALMGVLQPSILLIALLLCVVLFVVSFRCWQSALRFYSSASS
ncbi:MAG TPA: ABC-2 family transporter protein [Patescibacteria group bacterium]|nr:ABC-2 family transporter protein [Patescibacteria group bacterium]